MRQPYDEALQYLQKALDIIDSEGLSVASCHVQHAIDLVTGDDVSTFSAPRHDPIAQRPE